MGRIEGEDPTPLIQMSFYSIHYDKFSDIERLPRDNKSS